MILHKYVSMGGHERTSLRQTWQQVVLRQCCEGCPGHLGFPTIQPLVSNVLQQQAGAILERTATHCVVPGLVSPRNAHRNVLDGTHWPTPYSSHLFQLGHSTSSRPISDL